MGVNCLPIVSLGASHNVYFQGSKNILRFGVESLNVPQSLRMVLKSKFFNAVHFSKVLNLFLVWESYIFIYLLAKDCENT